jgi:multidrug efflux system membrane fusion protein
MQLSTAKDALVIPMAAVQRGPDGSLIYIVGADKKIAIQPVTIAMTQGNIALIASGLQAGQQVVIEGQDKLQSGSLVTVKNAAPPNPAPLKSSAPASAQQQPIAPPPARHGASHLTPAPANAAPTPTREAANLGGKR